MAPYGGDDVKVVGEWAISSLDGYYPLTFFENWQEKALVPYSTVIKV
jgi:hypothetical protein